MGAASRVCIVAIAKGMLSVLRCICFFACLCGIMGNLEREQSGAFSARGHGGGVIVNYAEIRSRVAHGFIEKANEMADALAVLQELSIATSGLSEQITKHCSK